MSEAIKRSNDFPVSERSEPALGKDLLTEVLRKGARELLAQAVEQEVQEWLGERSELRDEHGRKQVVRNGHLPERTILTGIGPVAVRQPRVRHRRPVEERELFSSKILPPYLRKTKSLEELIPWLSLKGISTGGFQEALQALVGPECPGLSANTITRLKEVWQQEYDVWSKRSLAGKEYVYVWADGIYSNVRLEDDRVCLLVLIGVTTAGQKELLAVEAGHRESEESWDELLTFYDFPAEHWKHIRTANPMESTFATIRLRHRRTKGNGTRKATLTMLLKLAESAARRWRLLDGAQWLIEVAKETKFQDGQILTQVAA